MFDDFVIHMIFDNITAEADNNLCFTAVNANSTVKLTKTGSPTVSGLQYKVGNGSYLPYTIDTVITCSNVGDKVYFRNTENTLSTDSNNYVKFVTEGMFDLDGSLTSMLNGLTDLINKNYCFCYLFNGCKIRYCNQNLLPFTALSNFCYAYMFKGCRSLTNVPNLPATTLTLNCYVGMFYGCTSLTTIPSGLLPATSLAQSCYGEMFSGCISLTTIPSGFLPATTLTLGCYGYMFGSCRSLTTIPSDLLPATTVKSSCYSGMFKGCTSLTNVPNLPATTLKINCYGNMFNGCTSLTNAPNLPATTLETNCYVGMFNGCTSLSSISANFTSWGSNSTTDWVKNVANSGTFNCSSDLTVEYGNNRIPTGWTVVNI